MVTKGEREWGGVHQEFGIRSCKLPCVKQTNEKYPGLRKRGEQETRDCDFTPCPQRELKQSLNCIYCSQEDKRKGTRSASVGEPLVLGIKWVLGAFCQFRSWQVLPPESQKEFFNVSDYFVFFSRPLGKQSHCTKQKTQEDEALLICVSYHQGVINQKASFYVFFLCLCYSKIKNILF